MKRLLIFSIYNIVEFVYDNYVDRRDSFITLSEQIKKDVNDIFDIKIIPYEKEGKDEMSYIRENGLIYNNTIEKILNEGNFSNMLYAKIIERIYDFVDSIVVEEKRR